MSFDALEGVGSALSISELQAKEDVTPGDIVATLWDYADSGAAISGLAVVGAIERSDASETDLRDIQEAAVAGIIQQAKNLTLANPSTVVAEQGQYAHVVGHVGVMLDRLPK